MGIPPDIQRQLQERERQRQQQRPAPVEVARAQRGLPIPQSTPAPAASPPTSQINATAGVSAARVPTNQPYPGANPAAAQQQRQQQQAQAQQQQQNVPIEVARAQRGLPAPTASPAGPGIPDQQPNVPGYQQYPAPIGPTPSGGDLYPANRGTEYPNPGGVPIEIVRAERNLFEQGPYAGGSAGAGGGVAAGGTEQQGHPMGMIGGGGGGGGGGGVLPAAAPPGAAEAQQPTDVATLVKDALQAQPEQKYKIAPAIQQWLANSGLYGSFLAMLQALGLTDIGGIGAFGFPTDFQIPANLADIDLTEYMTTMTPEDRTNIGLLLGSLLGTSTQPTMPEQTA